MSLIRFIAVGIWLLTLVSCSRTQIEPDLQGNDSQAGATTSTGSELSWDQSASDLLVLNKGMAFTDFLAPLNSGLSNVVYSIDFDRSTCDEHPWSETIGINQDGTLVGFPIMEGTCVLTLVATSGVSSIFKSLTLKIVGCSTYQQTISLSNDDDDGYYYGPLFKSSSSTGYLYLGQWSDSNGLFHHEQAFWRFQLAQAIPKGATINSAIMTVDGIVAYSGAPYNFEIGMVLSDNAPAPTADNSHVSRDRFATVRNWLPWDLSGFNASGPNSSPDIYEILQSNLNSSANGLAINSYVTVLARTDVRLGSANGELAFHDTASGTDPTLTISWNECQAANEAPKFAFTQPNGSERMVPGSDLSISWTDSDPDSNATIDLYLVAQNSSDNCSAGVAVGQQISEDETANTRNHSIPTNQASGVYYICAVVNDGINDSSEVLSQPFTVARNCVWTGATDNDWDTAGNWSSCNSVVPTPVDNVSIPVTGNAPILSSVAIIHSIAGGIGGGEVTVNPGARLSLEGSRVESSVALKGSVACTTCFVDAGDNLIVNNNATLTLNTNIKLSLPNSKHLLIGDGTSAGHLVANGTGSYSDWPELTYMRIDRSWWGVIIEGTPTQKSTVNLDGLKITDTEWYKNSLTFIDYFDILGMDNVAFSINAYSLGGNHIKLAKCDDTADITDTTWNGLLFLSAVGSGGNVDANNCLNESVTINGDATLPGYGIHASWNNANILTFNNSTTFSCTFNKASGAWRDAANWNGCANGRNGWPDINDDVTIPSGQTVTVEASGPTVNHAVGRILGGGGTIEFEPGATLVIGRDYNGQIRGDITIGSSDGVTCSDCGLFARGDLEIRNGATLTMADGARIVVDYDSLKVGTGTEAGHLVTGTISANETNWPIITAMADWSRLNGIVVQGISGSTHSSVSLNRAKIHGMVDGVLTFDFVDEYTINQFDNIVMSYLSGAPNYIRLRGCSSSTFNDTSWSQIDFVNSATGGYNIDACSDAPTITMGQKSGGTNAGYGASFEVDPGNKINWP